MHKDGTKIKKKKRLKLKVHHFRNHVHLSALRKKPAVILQNWLYIEYLPAEQEFYSSVSRSELFSKTWNNLPQLALLVFEHVWKNVISTSILHVKLVRPEERMKVWNRFTFLTYCFGILAVGSYKI